MYGVITVRSFTNDVRELYRQCSPRGLSSAALSGVRGVWIVPLPAFFSSLLPPTSPHHPPSLPAAAVRPSVHHPGALQIELNSSVVCSHTTAVWSGNETVLAGARDIYHVLITCDRLIFDLYHRAPFEGGTSVQLPKPLVIIRLA